MGEPACLVRSFSHPSSECSNEPNEVNPYRALGESISFGRYMSESLAWEKWSVFSHNRYLEEVEKFSKPGSVAQMKAYFEAHYKKKAAERAATSLECANTSPSNVSKPLSVEKICNYPSMDSGLAKGESLLDEQPEKDVPDTEVVGPLHVNAGYSSDHGKELDASLECANTSPSNVSKPLRVEKIRNDSAMDSGLTKGESLLDEQPEKDVPDTEVVGPLHVNAGYSSDHGKELDASLQCANTSPSNVSKPLSVEKIRNDSAMDSGLAKGESLLDEQPEKDVPDTEVVGPLHVNAGYSSDHGKELEASKVEGENVEIQNCTDDNNSNQIEKSGPFSTIEDHLKLVVSPDKEMLDKEPASPSVLALTSKKGLKKSSTKLFNESRAFKGVLSAAKQETSVQTKKGNVVAPRSKNDVEDSVDRKRLRKNSLHASIHCSSKTAESSSKFSPVIQKIRNSTVYAALLNGSKNNSTTLQRGTEGAANVERKRFLTKMKFEDEGTKRQYQSIARGITAERKLNSLSADQSSKSLSGNGSNPRSSFKFSPFNFRSEERAAKRKEFFEKLEEKRDANKAEKKHQHSKPQGKGTPDAKRLLESSGLKTEGKQDSVSVSQLPNNRKKMPLTWPQSPKLGRKSTSIKVVNGGPQASSSGSTKSTNIEAEQKRARKEIRSIPSLSAKNARENSSPNIQS